MLYRKKEEPNVLVLDMAEYRLDDGDWREKEEILRLDNVLRKELGYPQRADAYAQPWIYGEQPYEHQVSLRFVIRSEVEAENVLLALENPDITELFWNQQRVISPVEGYYTDHQIRTRKLGRLQKGENLLEARISYHSKVNIENMYLLGDFGVAVTGSRAMITAPVKELAFGDICGQGLAFYGGKLGI